MKKITKLVLIVILGIQFIYSQDIIVLKNGKSINSKVVLVENGKIYYKLDEIFSKKVKSIDLNKIANIYFEKQLEMLKKSNIRKDSSEITIAKNNKKPLNDTIEMIGLKKENKKEKQSKQITKKNKRFGVGVNIFFTEKNKRFSGLSLDFYLNKHFNTAIGYGYFQGIPKPYANASLLIPINNSNWSIGTSYQLIIFDNKSAKNLEILPDHEISDKNYYNIIGLEMEYRDKTGLSSKFWIGTSFVKSNNITKYSELLFGIRIAGQVF